jgi:hypothetical protein
MEIIEDPSVDGLVELPVDSAKHDGPAIGSLRGTRIGDLRKEPPCLGPRALARLQRLQSRVDGATEVAQAAINAHQAARDTYQRAFLEYCEDAEIAVPPGEHGVDIDWASGAVSFIPK